MTAATMEVVRDTARAAALLDEQRLAILRQLDAPDSAAGLARKLGLPRQRVNYHLRELERQRLVELVEERRKGNCIERVVRRSGTAYVISPDVLGSLGDATATPDRFSSAYQLAVAAHTIREVAALREKAGASGKSLATFTLQVDVRFRDAAARAAFADELAQAVAGLVEKHHDARAAGGRWMRFAVTGHPTAAPASG